MKISHLLLSGLLVFCCCARFIKAPLKDRILQKVYKVEMDKDSIFDKSVEWLAKKFTSTREVIEVKDKKNSKIIGRGLGKYSEYFDYLVDRQFGYTITIETKKNKYRVTFENLVVYYDERSVIHNPAKYKHEINSIKIKLDKLCNDLYRFIAAGNKNKIPDKKDDW